MSEDGRSQAEQAHVRYTLRAGCHIKLTPIALWFCDESSGVGLLLSENSRTEGALAYLQVPTDANDREIKLTTARMVLEAAQSALKRETYVYAVEIITDAILALYPELAQPVEPSSDGYNPDEEFDYPAALAEAACDDVSEPVEPGKEPAQ